jgi:hypothetical protein
VRRHYLIYDLCGRGRPVGPVIALSCDGGGIPADQAAGRPVQGLALRPSLNLPLESGTSAEGVPQLVWLTLRTPARLTGIGYVMPRCRGCSSRTLDRRPLLLAVGSFEASRPQNLIPPV